MGERHAAPSGTGAGSKKQAEGVRTGNEKLEDKGQQGEKVTTERKDGTFIGGKDRMGQPSRGGGSKEGHVVETGAPADILDEDKLSGTKQEAASNNKKGGTA
jgi:hypothetical protein